MFISLKKKFFVYAASILLAVSVVVICLAAKEVKNDVEAEAETEPVSVLSGKKILIDPGHGGFDAGASANGVEEKNVNLEVSLLLRDKVSERGGIPVMTRETDISTADGTEKGSKKAADLKKRKAMADEADIMVSIHMNKFEQSRYWGTQVFYAEKSTDSRALGESIQKSLKEFLNDGNERVAKESDGSIFLLKNAVKPTVIVECGFLSNPQEAAKLVDKEYQSRLAEGICIGIEQFFDVKLP